MNPSSVQTSPRVVVAFDQDWRFTRREPQGAAPALAYERLRPWLTACGAELVGAARARPAARPEGDPGADVACTRPGFDDSGWRRLDLPHDWGIEGPFSQELPGETGKLPWQGAGWYRKRFAAPAAWADRQVFIEFDGAMAHPAVWLGGRFVGGWVCGYTTFRLDLTPYLNCGGDNVLAVRLDNPPDSSRWYPGSGLYRHVRLLVLPRVRVAPWGVFVTTPRATAAEAWVDVDLDLENQGGAAAEVAVRTRVFALDDAGWRAGAAVAESEPVRLVLDPAVGRTAARANHLRLRNPRLWDLEHRHRYVAVTTVEQAGKIVDEVETPFGIRTIVADAERGLALNGRPVALRGVCLHHDLGALGTAVHESAIERQFRTLRERGCNAIRTSHNPPAPEVLEACDRMGFLVMVEAFDCWRLGKKGTPGVPESDPAHRYFDYARVWDDWFEKDLRAMVRRDRNHPCVAVWSIGNEVREQWSPDGWRLAVALAGIVREEDRTRPVTSGFNNAESGFNGFERAVDWVGFNYKPAHYEIFHRCRPTVPVYGAETASTVSSRGVYVFPVRPGDKAHGLADFQISSYDWTAPEWAWPPDVEWRALDATPTLGEFVWTGFDYLGEPTPYNADETNLLNFADSEARARAAEALARLGRVPVPSRSSYFGIVDLAGFPKDRFFLYRSRWRPELPAAHIVPHWNWPERLGLVTPVQVYASGDEAELFLDGRSLGRRRRGPGEYRFFWDDVVYQPGELRVVVWKGGAPWAEASVRTTGPATALAVSAERATAKADGRGLAFVRVAVTDAEGRVVPRANPFVRFTVDGPGALVATDNGDPTDHEVFSSPRRRAFNGLALAIVRTRRGEPGTIVVRARSDGLAPGEAVVVSAREGT